MRTYKCPFGMTAVTDAVDLVELAPAADKPICILRAHLGQVTEVGDAMEEFLETTWVRGNTTSGSGGTSAVAGIPCDANDAVSGFTYESLNTTQAASGTPVTVDRAVWAIRGGMDHVFLPEERIKASAADTLLCWRLGAAPEDSITLGGSVTVGEL
jgi:hypothetical protein